MANVTLKYKGATIGELSESGNKTIKTAGKYCEADILLEYEKSGAAIQHGLEILTFDSNGLPETAKIHGQLTPREFYNLWNGINKAVPVALDDTEDHIPWQCFVNSSVELTQQSLNKIKTADDSAFAFLTSSSVSHVAETLILPEFTGEASAQSQRLNRFRAGNAYYYGAIRCPKMQTIGRYDFYNCRVPNFAIEIGSVGFPVQTVDQQPFGYTAQIGTVTIYTTPDLLSTISAAAEGGVSAGKVTFIYKSSIDGETLQTNVR